MEIKWFNNEETRRPGEMRILPVFEDQDPAFAGETAELLKTLRKGGLFTGKKGTGHGTRIREFGVYQNVMLVGLGTKEALTTETLGLALGTGIKEALDQRCTTVDLMVPLEITGRDSFVEVGRAAVLAGYRFDRYKAPDADNPRLSVSVLQLVGDQGSDEGLLAVHEGMSLGEAINQARDLVNQPANRQNTEDLAEQARRIGRTYGADVEILGEKRIASLGMQAFLAVADASRQEPALIVIRYRGDGDHPERILGLVGKGILYDTGGLSIKSTEGMSTMKTDMAGAAAVIAATELVASRGLRVNLTTVVAACENAIGPANYRPGDILDTMAGKTVYVGNTDAEGRLTLADAVYYISKVEKADRILDLATLTGAAEVALGTTVAAGISTDDHFYGQVDQAAKAGHEYLWRLPAGFEEYKELNKADDADLTNSGGRYAGAITAGLFVGEFTEGKPWVHVDIAGPSWTEKPNALQTKGATGYGVGLLYNLARNLDALARGEESFD